MWFAEKSTRLTFSLLSFSSSSWVLPTHFRLTFKRLRLRFCMVSRTGHKTTNSCIMPNYLKPNSSPWVGVNCSKFDCLTIICSTLLAGNQLLDTKFINCSNPVNHGLTGFEQMTKILSIAQPLNCCQPFFLINYFTETARIQSARHFLQLKMLNILNWLFL